VQDLAVQSLLACTQRAVRADRQVSEPSKVGFVRPDFNQFQYASRFGLLDEGEGIAEVWRQRVFGGEGVVADTDLDGAVAAGGADELPDGPAGAVLGEPSDGQGGEDDRAAPRRARRVSVLNRDTANGLALGPNRTYLGPSHCSFCRRQACGTA
jgi:hypothetical protein